MELAEDEPFGADSPVSVHEGDASWHDGPGWYYTLDDYPDEGSCGAFETRALAIAHAAGCGYAVDMTNAINEVLPDPDPTNPETTPAPAAAPAEEPVTEPAPAATEEKITETLPDPAGSALTE